MIFAVETEERALYTFQSREDAIAACEGLDVEAAVWLFWDESGEPLEPKFTVPNKRGLFSVSNGVYSLIPTTRYCYSHLSEALENVTSFMSPAPFDTREGILRELDLRA